MSVPKEGKGFLARHRYLLLFISLLGFFALSPVLGAYADRGLVLDLFSLWVVASGVMALRTMGKSWIPALILGSFVFFSPSLGVPALDSIFLVRLVLQLGFLGFTCTVILAEILSASRVTLDRVLGAASVYMLLGIFWGFLFYGVETLSPGSFHLPEPGIMRDQTTIQQDLIYYSFVTLTTVGYGEIFPVAIASRVLAVLEAVLGQLYLVILVARMVSLQLVHSRKD